MVEIISKSNGPRKEDAAAKHFLRENAGTINKIAQQLSGGRLRAPPGREQALAAVAKKIRSAPRRDSDPRPYTKISLNGRVIAVDFDNSRQLHHFGEFRGVGPSRRFYLAVTANGFFSSLDEPIAEALRDLDRLPVPDASAEESLLRTIDERLGYANPDAR